MTKEEVKEQINNNPFLRTKTKINLINSCEELIQTKQNLHLTDYDIIYSYLRSIPIEQHICPVCGSIIHVNPKKIEIGFAKTCSRKCACKNPERNKKIAEGQRKNDQVLIQQKRNQTNLKRYGTVKPQSLESVKEQTKETIRQKYGCDYTFQSPLIQNKIKQTNLQRYGFENAVCSPQIKEKIKQTNLKRYGVTSTSLIPQVKAKQINTLKENYGVTQPMDSEEIKQKIIQAKYNLGYDSILRLAEEEHIKPLFNKEDYKGGFYDKIYKWKCLECEEEFEGYYNNGMVPKCRKCHPIKRRQKQTELTNFIKSIYSGTIIEENREILKPKELDIYIHDLKLAFEFNGTYWHSSEQQRMYPNYHKNKTKLCLEKGIKLIHVWEYDWDNPIKQNIIKERIKSIICDKEGIETVYARKCKVTVVDNKDAIQFQLDHHLQGSINAAINLGLYHKDELVAVMTFGKPRFNKSYEWELLRYCSKGRIVGGASKLLKYFERNYNPKSLISYANHDWTTDPENSLYKKLGFTFKEHSTPSYVYCKGDVVLSRYQCQKHKLKELLGEYNFNEAISETENMYANGYVKLYDCGNLVFEKKY